MGSARRTTQFVTKQTERPQRRVQFANARFALGQIRGSTYSARNSLAFVPKLAGGGQQVPSDAEARKADKEIWTPPQASSFFSARFSRLRDRIPSCAVKRHEAQAFGPPGLRRRTGKPLPAARGNGMGIRGEGR